MLGLCESSGLSACPRMLGDSDATDGLLLEAQDFRKFEMLPVLGQVPACSNFLTISELFRGSGIRGQI